MNFSIIFFNWLIYAAIFCLGSFSTSRPNIIFILTDDQDEMLGGMMPMVKTRQFFTENGIIFQNAFTTVPLCCPSRASIFTGKYQYNHKVFNNSKTGNCYGEQWKEEQEDRTFVTYLRVLNYTTFYAGKYMNQYGVPAHTEAHRVPPGWNHWIGLVGNSVYYNYTLSVNGEIETHGSDPKDYLTDVINDRAMEFLRTRSPSDGPFFMMLSPPACHAPFTPSDKYQDRFPNVTAPRTPNYNKWGGQKKHWLLRHAPSSLSEDVLKTVDNIYRSRWATLLSVDDMVQNIVSRLKEQQLLENTYIFFSSDNGFHFGQFSLPWDKRQMYEFDIRIPLMIYGPNIVPGTVRMEPVVNIDFAPTFIELAGLTAPADMDGFSLAVLLNNTSGDYDQEWRTSFIVEHHGESSMTPSTACGYDDGVSNCFPDCICEDARNNTYTCVRTLTQNDSLIYCTFKDAESFVEMYDLDKDPYQMQNIADGLRTNDYIGHVNEGL